jgi:hypothetical protein
MKDKRDDNNDISDLAFTQEGSSGGYTFTGKCFRFGKEGYRAHFCPEKNDNNSNNNNNKSKTIEGIPESAAATTDKVVTEELNHTDGTTRYEVYEDDFELMFCQRGNTSVGEFDYEKACNQVLSQMVSIEINPWWVLLDNWSTMNIFLNRKLLANIRQISMYVDVKCNAGSRTTNWIGYFPGSS